ncbi:aspartate aminotransferase, cytoplasmic-like [Mizuhopecten yessoensis]|uniref:Aspartate aminotransferase n=1 Tax=Mizuhopecten yessoensis TaxID=6573 RepID=A0A210QLD0_MIZYE|nr:aspartate aminotransferase, cytoplasmic-like [Mizuhopecten yessoensis]OWF49471.1 Aspartate aminotransferase, cytoplasmic [Mizuhopecten yessoensis]
MAESMFSDVKIAPPIEVFSLTAKYNEDKRPIKVNLGVGAYRTDEDKPWVLPVVRTVEAQMACDATLNHEYLPVAGLAEFSNNSIKLLLGEDSPVITQNRVLGTQAVGGTGALKLAAEFMHRHLGVDVVYVSKPTWGNHRGIFKDAGFSQIREYRYWKADTRSLDFDGMMEDLKNAPERACVILHGCAHNPTGVDATPAQWVEIADVCQERNLTILIDIAYQGFATGDLDKDASAVRYMQSRGFEMFIAQSFSKNFGLYNERVGNLVTITKTNETVLKVRSQMDLIVRTMWSNPPNHGARVVCSVLNNPACYTEWKEEVKKMASRILTMRDTLYQKLVSLGTPGSWTHITTQRGMFSYTGLSEAQVDLLQSKYHIYMLKSGRINMCGLTSSNIDYVADAIHSVVCGDENQQQKQASL